MAVLLEVVFVAFVVEAVWFEGSFVEHFFELFNTIWFF